MALTQYASDPNVIAKLPTYPGESKITVAQLKAYFDQDNVAFKSFFDNIHLPEQDAINGSMMTTANATTVIESALTVAKSSGEFDGREIALQKTESYIQWRYVGDSVWQNLIALSAITGKDGTNGTDGTNGGVPCGTIAVWGATQPPDHAFLCDGSEKSRITYARLFDVIGTTFGVGDGVTTFNLPNLKGSVPVGYDSTQPEFSSIGIKGGEKTHTLSVDEMPAHKHTLRAVSGTGTLTQVPANNALAAQVTTPRIYSTSSPDVNMSLSSILDSGGGLSHNNLQPYTVVNYIIYYEDAIMGSSTTTIVNDLTTGGTTSALSAEQGKVVGAAISELSAQKADKTQENWITPTLVNGWTATNGTPQYYKDNFGIVHFRGGLNPANKTDTSVFMLPDGYTPSATIYFSFGGAYYGVLASGVFIYDSETWGGIGFITFKAEA